MLTIKRKIKRKLKERLPADFLRAAPYVSTVYYPKRLDSTLNQLCKKYGTDKGGYAKRGEGPFPHEAHTYADIYELLYGHCRRDVKALLECGIGTNNTDTTSNMGASGKPGASLRCWSEYFPNAQIVGIDIDDRVLFSEDRIQTFQVDQTSQKSIKDFAAKVAGTKFDIIIDDGLHEFEAAKSLFEHAFSLLKDDGQYFIEDVEPRHLDKYSAYFSSLSVDVRYFLAKKPGFFGRTSGIILLSRKPG